VAIKSYIVSRCRKGQ